MKKEKSLSFVSKGLKYKLRLALALMSLLPLMVCVYLVSTYALPQIGLKIDIILIIAISVFISVLGFIVVKEVFDRIISVTTEAKLIAAGDVSRKVSSVSEDELGDLGGALNQLTHRIRSNMDELKTYSEKTTEINMEIQKRILVLSSLLQVSSLISQGAKLEEVLKLTVEKSRFIANADVSYLFFKEENSANFYIKIADGVHAQHLLNLNLEPEEAVTTKFIDANRPMILDKDNALPEKTRAFVYEQLKMKNIMALPIYLRGRITGLLGIGNTKDNFSFTKDDIELLDIFAKQVAIAVENDQLTHRIEKLEIKDPLTGLYNEAFIRTRLQEEIKRAIIYQRPCAYTLLNIDDFEKYRQSFGSLQAESTLKRIALIIRDSVTEIARVGRVGDNEFAIVLPEKNKRQAQSVCEDVRKKIELAFSQEHDPRCRLTVSGGASENPLDGVEADELIAKAKDLVNQAKQHGKNRVA